MIYQMFMVEELFHVPSSEFASSISFWQFIPIARVKIRSVKRPEYWSSFKWCEANERPEWSVMDSASPMLRSLLRQYNSLKVLNGFLYHSFYNSAGEV